MFRFGCVAVSLWLLLALGGYRHEIFAPTHGQGGSAEAGACVLEPPDAEPAADDETCGASAPRGAAAGSRRGL